MNLIWKKIYWESLFGNKKVLICFLKWGDYFMKFRKKGEKKEKRKAPVKTALVLSGGGAKGAYQVGVIEELLKKGIKIDLITGSSIGAFNGALLAEFINKNMSSTEIEKNFNQIWKKIRYFLKINWQGFLENILTPLDFPSLFTNKILERLVEKYISADRHFYDYTDCQLSITGTNLSNYEMETFDFNSNIHVNKAILASMAYPGALPAVNIKGDYYIDGGVLNNAPLKEAILWGATSIYVVFLTPLSTISGPDHPQENKDKFSALDVIGNLIDLATDKLMYGDLKTAGKINSLIKLLNNYRKQLPDDFFEEICQLYNLKSEDEKKIIKTVTIAPDNFLKPPGVMGFSNSEALKNIIDKGKSDTRNVLQQGV